MKKKGTVVKSNIDGQSIYFFVENERDEIQKHHFSGDFYEQEELSIIRKYINSNSTILDVGSNIGNHTLFMAKFVRPRQIICVEPFPSAYELLELNVAINGLSCVNLDFIGIALSDKVGEMKMSTRAFNLGASRQSNDGTVLVPTIPGDYLLRNKKIDFIKLDAEGMEISVLSGLSRTIERDRPTMFIEVENSNMHSFLEFIEKYKYSIAEKFKRYSENENFLISPLVE